MLTPEEIKYIIENGEAVTDRLLLGKHPSGINVPLCVKCIEARKKMKVKAPLWHTVPSLVYPFAVSVEQGSSQMTALLKQQLILEHLRPTTELPATGLPATGLASTGLPATGLASTEQSTFVDGTNISGNLSTNKDTFVDGEQYLSGRKIITADLTGGMGIDSFFISRIAEKHYYFERNTDLYEATAYNFRQLGAKNIIVSNRDITADGCAVLDELKGKGIDLIYIDPARRLADGKKAILLQDYEPNVVELREKLLEISPYVLIKVSPMADISLNLKLLPNTSAVYVVTVDNECRELLFLLSRNHNNTDINVIFLYNKLNTNRIQNKESDCAIKSNQEVSDFELIVQKDNVTEKGIATYTSQVESYLYELNKGWLKAGAFNLASERYKCDKLAPSTHLYTSDEEIKEFPGKIFRVEEVIPFNKKNLKELAKRLPKADLTARNFPLDTNALKKLSGIKDGGNRHIFATTLLNGNKVLIVTNPNY